MARYVGPYGSSRRPIVPVRLFPARTQRARNGIAFIDGYALLDTGADISAISAHAAHSLGLMTRVSKPVSGLTGEADLPLYQIRIDFSGSIDADVCLGATVDMVGSPFRDDADMLGKRTVALVGLDLLSRCILYLDGPGQQFVFTAEPHYSESGG